MQKSVVKRLFIDCETSYNIVSSWRIGGKVFLSADNILKERAIICICWKWEGEKTVKFLKWDSKQSDQRIVKVIIPVLNDADEIISHNGDRFDIPWIKTRAAFWGVTTNPHWKTIDTCSFAKKRMYFNSNRLDYLGHYLGLGGKMKTEFNLWKKVIGDNDKSALNRMVKYCKRDVVLLENVYHKLSEHMASQTHVGVLRGFSRGTCSYCGSSNVVAHKRRVSATGVEKMQMQCQEVGCGKYSTQTIKAKNDLIKKK